MPCYTILCYTMLYYSICPRAQGAPRARAEEVELAQLGPLEVFFSCVYIYIYIYIYTYIHIHIHTYIHTLHYITLHYITLHYITLHYIHYIYIYIYIHTHVTHGYCGLAYLFVI